jgi:hypothetical protein
MPGNNRIFWNVRATRASDAMAWSAMRSSKNNSGEEPYVRCLLERVSAETASGVADPPCASASRPLVGL